MTEVPNAIDDTNEPQTSLLTDEAASTKTIVFEALARASIETVTVAFDGGGDSGQIGETTATSRGKEAPMPTVTVTVDSQETSLQDAIENLCWEFLYQEHGGWENNEGGCGTFMFRVADRMIDLDFTEYFTESHQHLHTF